METERCVGEDCVYDLLEWWGMLDYQDEQDVWLNGDGAVARLLLSV